MVTCSTVGERIHPYMDGELPEAARGEIERHLAACPSCRGALLAFEAMGRLLRRELGSAAGSAPSVWVAIADRLDEAAPERPGWGIQPARRLIPGALPWRRAVPFLAAAAAVLVAVSVGLERNRGGIPPEQLAQVASVEGGDHASVVLLAGTPLEPPIILITETPVPADGPEGGSSL